MEKEILERANEIDGRITYLEHQINSIDNAKEKKKFTTVSICDYMFDVSEGTYFWILDTIKTEYAEEILRLREEFSRL